MITKHINKLPWITTVPLTLLWAWLTIKNGSSFWNIFIELYIFGLIWWFLFEVTDMAVTKYRDKELLNNPAIRMAYIKQKLEEIDKLRKDYIFNE